VTRLDPVALDPATGRPDPTDPDKNIHYETTRHDATEKNSL